jgi:hypothetical protein
VPDQVPSGTPFQRATAVRPDGEGAYLWEVPGGWEQGRGAWGGLCIAAFLHAIEAAHDEPERTVRSVSAEIAAPARVGTVRLTPSLRRRGASLSVWNVRAENDQGLVGSMVAVMSTPRPTVPDYSAWGLMAAPDVPPAAEVPAVPIGPPLGPPFMTHLEMRPLAGLPFAGTGAATSGWVRLAEPAAHTAASLLALVDAWWPASLPPMTQSHAFATVSYAATLLVDPATVAADEPLLSDSVVVGAHEGFTSETRRLWSGDGRLLVDNLQAVALIS